MSHQKILDTDYLTSRYPSSNPFTFNIGLKIINTDLGAIQNFFTKEGTDCNLYIYILAEELNRFWIILNDIIIIHNKEKTKEASEKADDSSLDLLWSIYPLVRTLFEGYGRILYMIGADNSSAADRDTRAKDEICSYYFNYKKLYDEMASCGYLAKCSLEDPANALVSCTNKSTTELDFYSILKKNSHIKDADDFYFIYRLTSFAIHGRFKTRLHLSLFKKKIMPSIDYFLLLSVIYENYVYICNIIRKSLTASGSAASPSKPTP